MQSPIEKGDYLYDRFSIAQWTSVGYNSEGFIVKMLYVVITVHNNGYQY